METKTYPDEFLSALGSWQAGWNEDKLRRLACTSALTAAIAAAGRLPDEAFETPEICFRKRFLVRYNSQNGGDFVPLFFNGKIDEGVASWSTNYRYSKLIFKTTPRVDTIATIFKRVPRPGEVVLNIERLWDREDFQRRVDSYVASHGPNSDALRNFGASQAEVVLNAPLEMDAVVAFCGAVPSLESLCETARITSEAEKDKVWAKLVKADLWETQIHWLEGEACTRAMERAFENLQLKIAERMAERGEH